MKKLLSELTIKDIREACDKNTDAFFGNCLLECPFRLQTGFDYRLGGQVHTTFCKTNSYYINHHPNEEVEF